MAARFRFRVVSICAGALSVACVWALPAASAGAATCTANPHEGPEIGNEAYAEVDVSCDTPIANGGFTISTNRGATIPGNPEISGGGGSLSCNAAIQPPGSQFNSIISCNGSLDANATAKLLASFGPNACSSPAFAGQLAVEFGGGPTFGPEALPAFPCGGGGGGASKCDKVRPGHGCDPGGVILSTVKRPPRKATVGEAKHGLPFKMKFGVRGKAIVTIEVGGKVVGKTSAHTANQKVVSLRAKLSGRGARALAGKTSRALIHVEVLPNAAAEGFSTHGREYFRLKLKP
jgi:hypothetical protein